MNPPAFPRGVRAVSPGLVRTFAQCLHETTRTPVFPQPVGEGFVGKILKGPLLFPSEGLDGLPSLPSNSISFRVRPSVRFASSSIVARHGASTRAVPLRRDMTEYPAKRDTNRCPPYPGDLLRETSCRRSE